MRKLALALIPILVLLCLLPFSACQSHFIRGDKTAYRITLEATQVGLNQIAELESMLVNRGYNAPRQRAFPEKKRPNKVIDDMTLRMSSNPHYFVYIAFTYEKDLTSQKTRNVYISIDNMLEGAVVPEIKEEIDAAGDLVYDFLSAAVGKENVKQERFLTYPPWD